MVLPLPTARSGREGHRACIAVYLGGGIQGDGHFIEMAGLLIREIRFMLFK